MSRPRRRTPADELTDAFASDRRDLHVYARRRLGDVALADEAVQETFLRAWRSIHRFDARAGSVRMWLFGICRNAVTDVARRQDAEPHRPLRLDEAIVEEPPSGAPDGGLACTRAAAALAAMSAVQRDAVVQVVLFDRPYVEAALTLGVPVGTVKSRVHHGLRCARRAAG